jgi:hypothetical protein
VCATPFPQPLRLCRRLDNAWEVSDTLFCRAQHGMELPVWASNATAAGKAVFEALQDLNDWGTFNGGFHNPLGGWTVHSQHWVRF